MESLITNFCYKSKASQVIISIPSLLLACMITLPVSFLSSYRLNQQISFLKENCTQNDDISIQFFLGKKPEKSYKNQNDAYSKLYALQIRDLIKTCKNE